MLISIWPVFPVRSVPLDGAVTMPPHVGPGFLRGPAGPQIAWATAAAESAKAREDLPRWNLADLYAGIDAPELSRDLEAAERDAQAFRERYLGELAGLDGAALG